MHRHDDPITGDTPHDADPTAGDTYSGTPAMSRRVAAVGSTCNRVRFESTVVRILAIVDASAGDARRFGDGRAVRFGGGDRVEETVETCAVGPLLVLALLVMLL